MPRKIDPADIRVGHGLAGADSVEAVSLTQSTGAGSGLDVHVNDPEDAHDASAISIDGDLYGYDNVEGALDELSALLPPKPATVGKQFSYVANTGIPDWGVLKMLDGGLAARGTITSGNNDSDIYPYYHVSAAWSRTDPPFTLAGDDPATDTEFNYFDGAVPAFTGGGVGVTHAGGHTRTTTVTETARIVLDATSDQFAVVSGMVYPADRGVLALLYFPEPTTPATPASLTDFQALTPLQRCPAAILLGGGILSGCDGRPWGGMFTVGSGTKPDFDYLAYPGAFTGQPSLHEINSGSANVFPGVAGGGTAPVAAPTAGQVRGGDPPGTYAIPVLGGTTAATRNALIAEADHNFFAYRLPYLSDYTDAGLWRTPVAERGRHFVRPTVAAGSGALAQAGNYEDFDDDFWPYQVARYRHRFQYADPSGSGAGGNDHGSFVLVHFKTEAAFEAMVVAAVPTAPSASDLYSATLVNWTDVEHPDNITAGAGTTPSGAYHILRAGIVEDTDQALTRPVTMNTGVYTISRTVDRIMWVSGVQYFMAGGAGTPFAFETMDVDFSGVWEDGFRTRQVDNANTNAGMEMANPGFLYTGNFHSGTNLTSTLTIGAVASERVEFGYDELDLTDGPFTLTIGPVAADRADFLFNAAGEDLTPDGDNDTPKFSRNAKVRMFFRKPLANANANLSTYHTDYSGVLTLSPADDTVLFHSAESGGTNTFENPDGTAAAASTHTAAKDTSESFLDEVYRWNFDLTVFNLLGFSLEGSLITGPGMHFPATPLDAPVRVNGHAVPWNSVSFIELDTHRSALPAGELQVAGWPDRNPLITDGATTAIPSAGSLIYPQTDYSAGPRPSVADGDTTNAQPDYSAYTGDRVYYRAFDVRFSRSGTPEDAEGQPFVVFNFKGLNLTDFAYSAPGPGSTGIALLCKVPGLTTWMDIGRRDGQGPSKQDATLDGAGCQVVGPDTFDSVDQDTRVRSCQVKVNVGPTANLFKNSDGEVVILVKVIIKDNATGKALSLEQGGADATTANLIGLYGIDLVRLSTL